MAIGRPTVKGEARQLILDTAEELFASHGVEGVSLRTINAAAGVSPGVLHYHFGSREVLVHELISRHMQDLMTQREQLLKPLLAKPQPLVREIVHTLVDPLAKLAVAGNEAGPRYVRFIARLYSDHSAALEEVSQRYLHVQRHYPELLQRALPDADPASLDLKMAMANHAMLQVLSDLTSPGRPWLGRALQQVDNAGLTAMLVDFMSAGISCDAGRGSNE